MCQPARLARPLHLPLAWSLLALTAVLAPVSAAAAAPPFVWVEAEKPSSSSPKLEPKRGGPEGLLSEGRWLQEVYEKGQVEQHVPAEGIRLSYDLRAPEAGEYQAWARVGFEWARAPFEWRIGEGEWRKAACDARTTSLMRLGTWMEVAWQPLGTVQLPEGQTTLQVRLREPNPSGRFLFGLDCFAFVKGSFVPEGRLKPGEEYAAEVDRQAASHVFRFPEQAPTDLGVRVELPLQGVWQVARYDDPDMDAAPYEPVKALPEPDEYPLRWMGVTVPSNAWEKPELYFGHRLLYRARVFVPEWARGRGFTLHFSGTNWIASVFVNGQLVGTRRSVLVPWDQDVSAAIRPGEVNEIVVGIKGPWYAQDVKPRKTSLERERNQPNDPGLLDWSRWVAPIYPSTKGEGDGTAYGLVNPVKLVMVGGAYVSDVFVRTSVARKRLDASLSLLNPTARERRLRVLCEALDEKSGRVEQAFPAVEVTLAPGEERQVEVGGGWSEPRLWWPVDNPALYLLRTTVSEEGRPIDVHQQLFGFREITVDGPRIRLNGVVRNFWNWVEVSGSPSTPEEWLQRFRAEGNRFYRFSHDSTLRRFFPYREAMLDFFDRNGVPGRLSSCIDGMFISFHLNNPEVWPHLAEHVHQMVRAYRNHPSVVVYSIENELLYINGQNVYGGILDEVENRVEEIIRQARALDPTRPYMVDGGGALMGNRLEVDCPHYPEAASDFYPDNAYTLRHIADHSSRWPWDRRRPMIVGESFFYSGKLERQAWIGGDRVFRSRDEANKGAAKYTRLLMEGYRWAGVAGVCPWVALERIPGAEKAFSDLAAFTRRRAYRFTAGRPGSIQVKVFNDTLKGDPVRFEWALVLGGKRIAGASERLEIEPGLAVECTLRFKLPPLAQRRDATLLLRVSRPGEKTFEDRKAVGVLPPVASIDAGSPKSPLLVYDRSGRVAAFLARLKVSHVRLSSLAQLRGRTGLLVVGPDTLSGEESYGTQILGFAARGGRAVVLEQEAPLAGTALPAPVRTTPRLGGYAFPQALGTPVFAGLRSGDLEDWAGDHPTYKRAYLKPSGGARSLVECGEALGCSALVEAPAGRGVIVAVQLRVGAKLGVEPAADHLFRNLLEHYSRYRPASGAVAVWAEAGSPLHKVLGETGALVLRVRSLREALDPARVRVAVVAATAENLRVLARESGLLKRFHGAGGWVMLWGLQPSGLAEFNRLTGVSHLIRPFRLERVTLEAAGQALAATLGNRDFTFYSPRALLHGDTFLSEDVYTFVVGGGANVAPFCKMPGGPDDPLAYTPTWDDQDPYNYVNGLLNSDSWRYIRQIWIPEQGPEPLVFGFRRPAVLRQINLWNNTNYWTIQDLDIVFDGDTAHPLRVTLPAHGGLTEIKLEPARKVTKSVTLLIRSWRGETILRDGRPLRLVGIDNLQFLEALPPDHARKVRPLDNVGGLVAYPRGRGGLLLNQVKLMDEEPNPENAGKKVRLVATLLQNLGVGMRASSVMVPGVNAQFTPLDLTRYATRHIRARGGQRQWFGEDDRDLGHLKPGQQFLADVLYHVSDYVNAPVPQAVMLGSEAGSEEVRGLPSSVTGIAVNQRADALYFLHTARVSSPIGDWERRREDFRAPELWKYVIRYSDGSTAEAPVLLEEHVDHWLQRAPKSLPGARLAWSVPFAGADPRDERPALYSMAWTNPKPEVPIESIDVVLGQEGKRAVPALLGISLGRRAGG